MTDIVMTEVVSPEDAEKIAKLLEAPAVQSEAEKAAEGQETDFVQTSAEVGEAATTSAQ